MHKVARYCVVPVLWHPWSTFQVEVCASYFTYTGIRPVNRAINI